MRNLLAFVAAAALVFLGVGWYLDWFKVHPVPSTPGHHSYTIDIDGKKIGSDVDKGIKVTEEKLHGVLDKNHAEQAGAPPEKKQDVAKDSGSFLRKIVPDFSGHTEEADSTGKPQR